MVMKNKKGSEGISTMGIIGGFIIIALLVFVIGYFIYQRAGDVEGAIGTVQPADLDVKYASCEKYYVPSFQDSFCNKFDLISISGINNKEGYISCEYKEIAQRLVDNGKALNLAEITTFCGGDEAVKLTNKCNELKSSKKSFKGSWINGVNFNSECKDVNAPETCEGQKGEWKPSNSCPGVVITSTFDSSIGEECCPKA